MSKIPLPQPISTPQAHDTPRKPINLQVAMPINIHTHPGGNCKIIPWSELKFNLLGLYHLHQWQGVFSQEHRFFVSNQGHFESADIAWFASGMHSDGDHHYPQDHFHLLHNKVYQETKGYPEPKVECKALEKHVYELTFDMVSFTVCFFFTYLIYLQSKCFETISLVEPL